MEDVPASPPFIRKHAALIAGAALIAIWVMFFHVWPLAGLAVLAVGITLGFHSRKASLALLLCSPFVLVPLFSLGVGVLGYLSGQGQLRTHGERFIEDGNLDPKYRCPRSTSGCVTDGTGWLRETPNNLAIEILTTLFGPMRGAYAGPYPAREEAVQAVRTSRLQFLPGEVSRYADGLRLPQGEPIGELERQFGYTLDKDIPISATIYEGETVILGREKCVFLVERRTGKIYARYYFRCSAWLLLANGEADKAIAELDHAIEVDPRNPLYFKGRGEAYVLKGQTAQAAVDFKKALLLAPPDWHSRTEVGNALNRIQATGAK